MSRGSMRSNVVTCPRPRACSVAPSELLPSGDERRHELMTELAIAQCVAGDGDAAGTTLRDAIAGARARGERRVGLRAQMEAAYLRLLTEPEGAARELLAVAEAAVPAFEAAEDDRSLARPGY